MRLHAAWALGLRAGSGIPGTARGWIAQEPSPGVRRHMAVLLGGDRAALEALLDHDPSERVRETAMGLLAQAWSRDEEDSLARRVFGVARVDPSPDVRLAAFELLAPLRAHVATGDIMPMLADADARCASAALRLLLAPPEGVSGARALIRHGVGASADERTRVWLAVLEHGHSCVLLEELGGGDPIEAPIALAAFRLLHAERDADFAQLSWASDLADPGVAEAVLQACRIETVPHAWLHRWAMRFGSDDDGGPYVAWRALLALAGLGADGVRPVGLTAEEISSLSDRVQVANLAWFEDQDECDGQPEGSTRAWLLTGLARLLE